MHCISEDVGVSVSDVLCGLIPFYASNYLRATPDKTQRCAFHIENREANHQLQIKWYGKRLQHTTKQVQIGVTVDRSLTFKYHITWYSDKNENNCVQGYQVLLYSLVFASTFAKRCYTEISQ